jgi:hypothetical protein
MKNLKKFAASLTFLVLAFLAFQSSAFAADADKCTPISAVPFTISAAGSYCLTKDISTPSTTGVAISVTSDDVSIDLAGYTLGNLLAGTGTQAIGIQGIGLNNVTIQNGTVRGFYIGIQLAGASGRSTSSSGHLVTNVRADLNRFIGIQVLGSGIVVSQTQILHTGGSTASGVEFTVGLHIGGDGAQAVNNSVVDTIPPPSSNLVTGILINAQNNFTGAVAEFNRVSNVGAPSANAFGISGGAGAFQLLIVNNRVSNFGVGIEFIFSGRYRDNLTINSTVSYVGGTDEGNNQ